MARIILLLFFISCNRVDYKIYTECSTTEQAIIKWKSIDQFTYYYENNFDDANVWIKKIKGNDDYAGVQYTGTGMMESMDRWDVVAHEFGHFLGYKHSALSNSIMNYERKNYAIDFIGLEK